MFYGTFFYLSDGQSKDTKMPTSDKVPLLNRAFQKQDCKNQRNSLTHTCKLPYSSVRCQVAKMQNTADICRLSVTNALPVYRIYADFPLRMHYLFTLKEGSLFTLITNCQTAV